MNSYRLMLVRLAALTLLVATLLTILTACATTGIIGSRGVACTSLPPSISFAYSDRIQESDTNRLDTYGTVEQIREYNARIKAICEEK